MRHFLDEMRVGWFGFRIASYGSIPTDRALTVTHNYVGSSSIALWRNVILSLRRQHDARKHAVAEFSRPTSQPSRSRDIWAPAHNTHPLRDRRIFCVWISLRDGDRCRTRFCERHGCCFDPTRARL